MRITLKLFASLTDFLPDAHRRDNQMPLDLAPGTTVLQVIEPLNIPVKMVHLVLVNGHYVAPEDRPSRALLEGDVLAIWPPIAGG